MKIKLPNNDHLPGGSPSDKELFSYLLGEATEPRRLELQNWLASDPAHGDRLCDLATTILLADCLLDDNASSSAHSAAVSIDGRRADQLRFRRLVGLLALAASIAFVVFSLADRDEVDFQRQPALDQIAMNWADALPSSGEIPIGASVAEWVPESEGALAGTMAAGGDEFFADENGDTDEAFGFSNEPPEWLLAAVLEMQSNDPSDELNAVIP